MDVMEVVRKDAVKTIRDHISDANICMITNNILEWSLQPESLNNQWLDEDGNIWFLYFDPQNANSVLIDGRMEVFYSNRLKSRFLSLAGEISWAVLHDGAETEQFPFAEIGHADISTPMKLARFCPTEAYYWDEIVKEMVPLTLFEKMSA